MTSFFRDAAVWDQLKTEVLPALLAIHPNGGVLRAWSTGCSTGEEAYSLAIVFREVLEQVKPASHFSLQVFATDLDKDAIDKARAGSYPASIAADVSEARLRRFFIKEEHGFLVSNEIREMVIFAPQNLVMDPPFTKLDLITCRNLLIYLESDLQKKLLPLFHYSLNSGGILMLGISETVGQASDLFTPLPGKTRLYRRIDRAPGSDIIEFPAVFSNARSVSSSSNSLQPKATEATLNLKEMTDSILLQRYSPAAVLATNNGDIIYFSGKTGKYLEPAAGKANLNLLAMARESLSGALNEAFSKVVRQKIATTLKAVDVGSNGGGPLIVDITVEYLNEPAALRGMVLVVFRDLPITATPKVEDKSEQTIARNTRLAGLSQALQESREELKTARIEMQTSHEELKSTNEELQSTNEELQSTNEELTTSKEEMQSMNEELQTVNHELLTKVDELSRSSDDMKNLLNSTDIATLFLDSNLKVRRFTPQTASIFKLIPGDKGRPITDLVSELDYPTLAEDSREVLGSLIFHEKQVSARGDRWFTARIMPYRTQDNRIDGLVITFVDISMAKALELTLHEAMSVLEGRFSEQSAELDAAKSLENVLQKAQAVLEKRIKSQTEEIRQAKSDLKAEKGIGNDEK